MLLIRMCRTRSQWRQFLGSSAVRNKLLPTEKEGAVQDVVREVSSRRGADEGGDQGELAVCRRVPPEQRDRVVDVAQGGERGV
jgi:hypothetical protein